MQNAELSNHAREMTLISPERKEMDEEGNTHYFGAIPEYSGRILHVIVNPATEAPKIVTLFFDRRARRSR